MQKLKKLYEKSPAAVSIILCAAIITVFAAVYFAVGLLPTSARLWDATPNSIYTLHPDTVSALESIDIDIEVLIVTESGIHNSEASEKLLTKYAEKNKHIKLKYVYPEEVEADYGTLTAGCAVVKSQLHETVIYSADYYDITDEYFDISYNFYSYLTQSGYSGSYADFMYSGYAEYYGLFDLAVYQNTLTNALLFVSASDLTTLYSLTDHGESVLNPYLYPDIRESYTEVLFGKLSEGIPAHADGVLINNPTLDITENDAVILKNFLDIGGKLTVITSYDNIKKLTNLRAVCEEYGLTTDGGFICEDDENYNYGGYATAIIPTVNVDAFGAYLPKLTDKPLTTRGTGITVTPKDGIEVNVLMQSSPNAYTKQDIENSTSYDFNDTTDKRGQYALAAIAKNTENGSSLLWIPTATLGDSDYDTFSERNNLPVFVAALNTQYSSRTPIQIPAIELATEPLETTDGQFAVGLTVAIILPCALIAVGAFTVARRKKR